MDGKYKRRTPPSKRYAREKALELERDARQTRFFAGKDENKVSALYESAADEWVRQAAKRENPRDVKNSLSYAVHDYKLAEKITLNEQKKEQIGRKVKSLTLKIGALGSPGGLSKKLTLVTLAIASFLGALFFISFNLTGNAVGGVSQNNSNWISVVLFVLGMIFSFFYFKNKN